MARFLFGIAQAPVLYKRLDQYRYPSFHPPSGPFIVYFCICIRYFFIVPMSSRDMTSVCAKDRNVPPPPLLTTTSRGYSCIYLPLDAVHNSPTSTTCSPSILGYNSNSDGEILPHLQVESSCPSMATKSPITLSNAIPLSSSDSLSSSISSIGSSFLSSSPHESGDLDVEYSPAVHKLNAVDPHTNMDGCTNPQANVPYQCQTNASVFSHVIASTSGSDSIPAVSNGSGGPNSETFTGAIVVGRKAKGNDKITTQDPDAPCHICPIYADDSSTTLNAIDDWSVVAGERNKVCFCHLGPVLPLTIHLHSLQRPRQWI